MKVKKIESDLILYEYANKDKELNLFIRGRISKSVKKVLVGLKKDGKVNHLKTDMNRPFVSIRIEEGETRLTIFYDE